MVFAILLEEDPIEARSLESDPQRLVDLVVTLSSAVSPGLLPAPNSIQRERQLSLVSLNELAQPFGILGDTRHPI